MIADVLHFSNPLSKAENAAYPDTVAVALDMVNQRVSQLIIWLQLYLFLGMVCLFSQKSTSL